MIVERTRARAVRLRMRRPRSAELERELEQAAHRAEGVFESRAEMAAWLTCAFLRGPQGGAPSCGDVAAAACAVRFGCLCPKSSRPAQFVDLISRLPTPRLEALLALRDHSPV